MRLPRFRVLRAVLCAVAGVAPSRGAEAPGAPPEVLCLAPRDCIVHALADNLELRVERLNPMLKMADWMMARSRFEPALAISGEWEDSTTPYDDAARLTTGRESNEDEYTRYNGSIEGVLPTGLTYEIGTIANNHEGVYNRFKSRWDSQFGITLTQPLLRDAGTGVQMAEIRIARTGTEAAGADFEYSVSRTVADVLNAYVELIFRRDNLTARREALDLAEQLMRDNEARLNIGVMSPLDVSQARTEVASQTESVVEAERALLESENTLKRLIFRDVGPWLLTRVVPAELPPVPAFADPILNVAHALEYRPDLRERRLRIEQAGINLRVARNALLPQVDAFGGYALIGLEDSLDETYENTVDAYDRDWSVGVKVRIPLGMSEERGRKRRAELERDRAVLNLKQLEQDIIVEVDNAARAVEANKKRVDAAREARQFAYETLEAEQEKLNAGASTTFVVSRLQRDLALSKSNELRNYAEWQKSVVELAHREGTMLMRLGVTVTTPP